MIHMCYHLLNSKPKQEQFAVLYTKDKYFEDIAVCGSENYASSLLNGIEKLKLID